MAERPGVREVMCDYSPVAILFPFMATVELAGSPPKITRRAEAEASF
jgi:hypothetical protein